LERVTPVRDQQMAGTCWAHAALAAIESNVLAQGEESFSLSPQHLAWFVYRAPTGFTMVQRYFDDDPARPFAPNRNVFEQGGWDWQVVAALARRIGPVWEAACPYGPFPYSPDEMSPDRIPAGDEPILRHLLHAYYLAGPYQLHGYQEFDAPAHRAFADNVKTALQAYGAVVLVYNTDKKFLNASEDAFYQPAGHGTEDMIHAVALVGWADAYPKENMVVSGDDGGAHMPPADGAWIFKNSWGTDRGDEGYYHVSYYSRMLRCGTAYVTAPAADYDAVYAHDPLGWVHSQGFLGSDTAYFANVFTAGAPSRPLGKPHAKGTPRETLKAVSFYAGAARSEYVIRVYRNGVPGDPTSGILVSGPQSGTLDAPGYHTVPLTAAPTFEPGVRFAVVVRLRTPGYEFPIPVEYAVEGYSDAATASADQGYISEDGTMWNDAQPLHDGTTSVCLKAFTISAAQGDKGSGGGCSSGVFAPLALILFVPLILRKL